MRRPGLSGAFWPSDYEEELVRVALGHAEPAQAERVAGCLEVDAAPDAVLRLLPLLWRTLSSQGFDSPVLNRVREAYRLSWYLNTLLLAEVAPVIATLAGAGVDALVLKGAAAAMLYYEDHATRPLSDLDILVRPNDARRAVQALGAAGWSAVGQIPTEAAFDWWSRVDLENDRGLRIDLHWDFLSPYILPGASNPAVDLAWQTARPCPSLVDDPDSSVRTLGPAAHLLHAVVHGVWEERARLLWIADVSRLLDVAGSDLDWDGLVALTTFARRGTIVADALAYVDGAGFASVPSDVLSRLRRSPGSPHAVAWLRGRRFSAALGGFPSLAASYLDLRERAPGRQLSPRAFLRAAWNLDADASLVKAVPGKVGTVLRRARSSERGM